MENQPRNDVDKMSSAQLLHELAVATRSLLEDAKKRALEDRMARIEKRFMGSK